MAGALIITVFVIVAAAQAGIPTSLFIVLVAIAVGAAALTFTLAFGFGAQSVAHQITAGRYLGDDLAVGQTIRVNGLEGRIARFESSYVVLDGASGELIRVPNRTVLESVVTVLDGAAPGPTSLTEPRARAGSARRIDGAPPGSRPIRPRVDGSR